MIKNGTRLAQLGILIVYLYLAAFIVGCAVFYFLIVGPERKPQPLESEMTHALCETLNLASDYSTCVADSKPLAADFYPAFEKVFIPGVTTKENVISTLVSLGENLISEEDDVSIYGEYGRRIYDLTGDGFNQLVFFSNPRFVSSIILMRENKSSSPIPRETITYFCDQLFSSNEAVCSTKTPTYIDDIFPLIIQSFPLHTTKRIDVEKILSPFLVTEEPSFYRVNFYFRDNVDSQILFVFNSNQVLENMSFMNVDTLNLDAEVKNDLCVKFNLLMDDKKCNPEAKVDTSDFKELVYESFQPGKATYEDVQNLLGNYQFGFDPPTRDANGDAVMLSWYDFVGNNYYRIRFDFDTNGVVTEISFFYGDD